MSAECERAFSAAGKMVTHIRARLDAGIIGICQVLRSWYKAGVLPEADLETVPVDLDDYSLGDSDGDKEYRGYKPATSEIDSERERRTGNSFIFALEKSPISAYVMHYYVHPLPTSTRKDPDV
jgi:hypothetical protein